MGNNFAQETLNKIIKECPKAWGDACFYAFAIDYQNYDIEVKNNEIVFSWKKGEFDGHYSYSYRNFFDYFDSKGKRIYVGVGFEVCICTDSGDWVDVGNDFDKRSEAEWAGIYNAFKIEEEELCQQQSK